MKNPKQRGYSLIEIMVSMALISIALAMTGALFHFGVKMNRTAEERNALQGDRLKLSRKLQRTLGNSYRSGNTAFYMTVPGGQDDLALSIIVPDSWDDDNQQMLFGSYDVYYRQASDDTLRYLQIPITPTEVANPLSETDLRAAITATPGVVILESVSLLQLFTPPDGAADELMGNPIGLRLTQQTTRGTPLTTELTFKLVSP